MAYCCFEYFREAAYQMHAQARISQNCGRQTPSLVLSLSKGLSLCGRDFQSRFPQSEIAATRPKKSHHNRQGKSDYVTYLIYSASFSLNSSLGISKSRLPSEAMEILPVSSETTATTASETSETPTPALCLIPKSFR